MVFDYSNDSRNAGLLSAEEEDAIRHNSPIMEKRVPIPCPPPILPSPWPTTTP